MKITVVLTYNMLIIIVCKIVIIQYPSSPYVMNKLVVACLTA